MPVTLTFEPGEPLVPGIAEERCRASVIVPARNEASTLGQMLDRLAEQIDESGRRLAPEFYEILLLLNNCTDSSHAAASEAVARHRTLRLHVIERTLPPQQAHVGTARRLLMDTAWHRLRDRAKSAAILSTDADTLVAPNWIVENLRALASGADAVGGEICWMDGEFAKLPVGVQLAYTRDRQYQRLLAELEDRLDPRPGDSMPRHLHHFGASLACTPEAYARAGGMPRLRSLEDVGLVTALERVGAKLRHEPRVRVYTSGRLFGRVEVGLSGQLRTWQQMCALGEPHVVDSAAWSAHRFRMLRERRERSRWVRPSSEFAGAGHQGVRPLREAARSTGTLPGGVLTEREIEQSFDGERFGEIGAVSRELEAMLSDGANAGRSVGSASCEPLAPVRSR